MKPALLLFALPLLIVLCSFIHFSFIRKFSHGAHGGTESTEHPLNPFLSTNDPKGRIICVMTITQTVDVPASRRLTIDVPLEVPAGQAILTFTPKAVAQEQKKEREFGCVKGDYWMAEDFNAPLDDFKDYM